MTARASCDELQLLAALSPDRRSHSREVGRKAATVAHLVPADQRGELVQAATLHDVGYAHEDTGHHAIDGARFLRSQRLSPLVCALVAQHSASSLEADERGLDPAVLAEFPLLAEHAAAHSVVWWADMTTGPQGQTVAVEQRLDEICDRYGPGELVTRFITRARPLLLAAGQGPLGSMRTLSASRP